MCISVCMYIGACVHACMCVHGCSLMYSISPLLKDICFCSPFSSVLQLNNLFRSIIQLSLLGPNLLISMFIFLFLKVLLCSFSNLRGLFVSVLKLNTLIFKTVLGLQKTEQTVQRGSIYLLFPSSVSSVFNILL